MTDAEELPVRLVFPDKHRAWAELIVAVERGDGRLLVPSDAPAHKGQPATLVLQIADEPPFELPVTVERIRRPSPRFARALILKLDGDVRRLLRQRLGALSAEAHPSFGRQSPRFNLHWPVTFRTPALLRPVETGDISADGMHVEIADRVEPGDVVELILHTPQGHQLLVAGEIQWTSEVSPKVGIRFLYRDEDERELMRALLLHAVGERLSVVGKAMILVVGDPDRLSRDLSALFDIAPIPVHFVPRREDALATVRKERPRVLFLPHDDAELAAVCHSVATDAELVGTQVVVFGRDGPDLGALAAQHGAHLAVAMPLRTDVAAALLEGLLPPDEESPI